MRHIDYRRADPLVQRAELLLHRQATILVECAQRFIEEQETRLEHQRTGERDPLLLPARHLMRVTPAKIVETDHAQGLAHLGRDSGVIHLPHFEREGDILRGSQMGKQRIALEHDADPPLLGRHTEERLAIQLDVAGSGLGESGDRHQDRRLSQSRGTQERNELAALYLQGDIIDRLHVPIDHSEPLDRQPLRSTRRKSLIRGVHWKPPETGIAVGCPMTSRPIAFGTQWPWSFGSAACPCGRFRDF